ncbi:RGase A [Xylariaceae sp. FL0255]|nr:RGase A [Xylariaceae sp. FL0255]
MIPNTVLLSLSTALAVATAQLSGTTGPTTTFIEKKAVKVCDVTDYGGVASTSDDLSGPLQDAINACEGGGLIYIPSGTYGMSGQVTIKISNWAMQIDGVIERTGSTTSGSMFTITSATNWEIFSYTGAGAIQANGYAISHAGYPRIFNVIDNIEDFSIHDLILVDSPGDYIVVEEGVSGELYNLVLRGPFIGGIDGIDIAGTNIWVHDVEVTNGDECVTTKSAAKNFLVENIYCNWSAGCACGSLGADVSVADVEYKNVYSVGSDQMFFFKSNGGSGSVSSMSFTNFLGHKNAYGIYIDSAWTEETLAAGNGVQYEDITFSGFYGDVDSGTSRPPVYLNCPAEVPCTGITVEDVAIWTDSGSEVYYKCENAFGSGACLVDSSGTYEYTSTQTITATPAGWSVTTMPYDLATPPASTASIAIPTYPASFFPGVAPISAIAAYNN